MENNKVFHVVNNVCRVTYSDPRQITEVQLRSRREPHMGYFNRNSYFSNKVNFCSFRDGDMQFEVEDILSISLIENDNILYKISDFQLINLLYLSKKWETAYNYHFSALPN